MAVKVTFPVEYKGPFWTHKREMTQATEQAVSATVDQAYGEIKGYLGTVLKNPTGAYQAAIHKDVKGSFAQVGDGKVVYGPWLETGRTMGHGGQFRRTRFRGYTSFRRTRRKIGKMLREAAKEAAARAVAALGGSSGG